MSNRYKKGRPLRQEFVKNVILLGMPRNGWKEHTIEREGQFMAGDRKVAAAGESFNCELERFNGELDAALVFAAAAVEAYRAGNADFAEACRADAQDICAKVISGLGKAGLPSEQLKDVVAKVIRVRQTLKSLHAPPRHEAA